MFAIYTYYLITQIHDTYDFSYKSLTYLLSSNDYVIKKVEQDISIWLDKINRINENTIFFKNYFLECDVIKPKLYNLKNYLVFLTYK